MQKTKYILCDLPNTLFDSRHRSFVGGYYLTGINKDTKNYACFMLVKQLIKDGYQPIFTHYALSRKRDLVEKLLVKSNLPTEHLYTDFASQDVYDNQKLKMHLYEEILAEKDLHYVIDNDPLMTAYWLGKEVALVQIPLGII